MSSARKQHRRKKRKQQHEALDLIKEETRKALADTERLQRKLSPARQFAKGFQVVHSLVNARRERHRTP